MISKKDLRRINEYLWELPKRDGMQAPARIYASEEILDDIFEDNSVEQLVNGASLDGIVNYAIAMPDIHEGYGVPIGFVGASNKVISPGACGFDINCGMRLLTSDLTEKDARPFLDKVASDIFNEVPSGLGKGRKTKFSVEQINKILEDGSQYLVKEGYGQQEDVENCEAQGRLDWANVSCVSDHAKNRGRDQVGTLGSGNHFMEIQKVVEIFNKDTAKTFGLFENQVVVMIHTGSRGLGHQVCSDYLEMMVPAMKKYGLKMIHKELARCPFESQEGQQYFNAMAAAANYAWANRQMIAYSIRKAWKRVLGKELKTLYDVAHNIIKRENEVLVHRKGATRAFPPGHKDVPEKYQKTGQPVLIPGSMGTFSYVLTGVKESAEAFHSTSHGAGRKMSRKAATRTISSNQVSENLKKKGIILKCHSIRRISEESPKVYKDIDEVVNIVHNAGLSKKVAKLEPLAVIKGE